MTDQFVNSSLDGLRIGAMATLLVCHTIVQDLPHHSAELVGHGPDSFLVSEPGYWPTVQILEDAALGFDRSIGRLIENSAHGTVALVRAVTVRDCGALLSAWITPHPGGQLPGRSESAGLRPYFCDDLLRGIDAQAGRLRQPGNGLLVFPHGLRCALGQCFPLLVDQFQPLQKKTEDLATHGTQGGSG